MVIIEYGQGDVSAEASCFHSGVCECSFNRFTVFGRNGNTHRHKYFLNNHHPHKGHGRRGTAQLVIERPLPARVYNGGSKKEPENFFFSICQKVLFCILLQTNKKNPQKNKRYYTNIPVLYCLFLTDISARCLALVINR